jgi:malate dehydrogenase
MSMVAIVGAGELGGAVARAIAGRGRFTRIRLIDEAVGVATGKALDIQQAGPVEQYDVQIAADGDFAAAAGASVVVIADRVGPPAVEWSGDAGLGVVMRLGALGVDAPLVFAGAGARDLIEAAVDELGIERTRLIGSAPHALASAVRAVVAIEADGSPVDVALSVIGVPPAQVIVPWSGASIAGQSATRVLDAPALARVDRRLPALWPPGPYALGSAAARVAEAVAFGSRRLFCCFTPFSVTGITGVRGVVAAISLVLGPRGVVQVVVPILDARERVVFENSVAR